MKQKITKENIVEFLTSGLTQAAFARKLKADASTLSRAVKKYNCEGNKMNNEQEKIITGAVQEVERELKEKKNYLENQESHTAGLRSEIDAIEDHLLSLKQKEAKPEPRDIYEPVEEMLGDHVIARFTPKQLQDALDNVKSTEPCKIGIAMRKI